MKDKPRHIHPLEELGADLLTVERPARYLGGELGSISRGPRGEGLLMALSFPDLYEIGMSNNAIRILYSSLNAIAGLSCERVFAPAPDFEELLRRKAIPLYTLESGLALSDVDILGFTLGYELAATSILVILERGGIPIQAAERGEGDPIVIMGGPAISNPHPFADFIDAAYIGEAEASFEDLMAELARMKAGGAGKAELLGRIAADPAVWVPSHSPLAGTRKATRAVYGGFSDRNYHTAFPVATVKTVQDHGTVEIMRGCPNGCRFCHAGYYYRPQRFKPYSVIREEVAELVKEGGYREITLSSLSSGDYPGIEKLLDALNAEWGKEGVSFQLPSLKISTFTLPILEKLAEVRKSGLTFAVETPFDAWQRVINKDVSFEQTVAILEEAKSKGFKLAKFYFMIGLPVPGGAMEEAKAIVEFFDRLLARVPMQLNVNVGTFVPKPHTPFQWSSQVAEDEALEAIRFMKEGLRRHRNLKLSSHSPFVSVLEGVISRGDERVGGLILEAYRRGARLDAWEDHFDRELWRGVLDSAGWNVVDETLAEHSLEAELPWDDIAIRVGKKYLAEEFERSKEAILTSRCDEKCNKSCGACSDSARVVDFSEHIEASPKNSEPPRLEKMPMRLVFSFSKTGIGRYYPHLSIAEAFSRAFLMLGLPVQYSEGFNPMPRLELVQPLPLGYGSQAEYGNLMLTRPLLATTSPAGSHESHELLKCINAKLPEGLEVTRLGEYPIREGKKIYSLASLSWGSQFTIGSRMDAGLSLQGLSEAMSKRMGELGLAGASSCILSDGRLSASLPDPKSRDAGLMRILESCMEERPIQSFLDIEREGCLARVPEGSEMKDYFSVFEELAKGS